MNRHEINVAHISTIAVRDKRETSWIYQEEKRKVHWLTRKEKIVSVAGFYNHWNHYNYKPIYTKDELPLEHYHYFEDDFTVCVKPSVVITMTNTDNIIFYFNSFEEANEYCDQIIKQGNFIGKTT